MTRAALRNLVVLVLAAAGAVWVAWLGFGVQTGGDYSAYFESGTKALLGGHLSAFIHNLPVDGAGGSIILRAPGALIGKLVAPGVLGPFRFGALECALAAAALGLWLAHGMRRRGASSASCVAVAGMYVVAPALLDTVRVGHPEEILGAVLCVSAVLLAAADRPALAGVTVALAVINKPWAVFAIGPVLLAAPGRRRTVFAAGALVALAWFLPAYLLAPDAFTPAGLSTVAHPQELWWPLAHPQTAPGVTPAYFLPQLVTADARQLAVLMMLPLCAALAIAVARARTARPPAATAGRRWRASEADCLGLLALLLLVRCLLDPSDHGYYHLPFVLALVAWDARSNQPPVRSLLATGLLWLEFHAATGSGNLTLQFVTYLAITLPLAATLARHVFARAGAARESMVLGRYLRPQPCPALAAPLPSPTSTARSAPPAAVRGS